MKKRISLVIGGLFLASITLQAQNDALPPIRFPENVT